MSENAKQWAKRMSSVQLVEKRGSRPRDPSYINDVETRKAFERWMTDRAYTIESVASDLGIPEGTVASRFRRIRKFIASAQERAHPAQEVSK